MRAPSPTRGLLTLASIALLVSVTAPTLSAQTLYGSIVGRVTDSSRAIIPGATVTIVSRETNLTRDTTTNADGTYTLANVLPGTYDVKVTLQGFREVVRTGVPVTVGLVSRVDVSLEIGTLTETVTVQSKAELLQTDQADVHTELRSTELTNLPLNQFRNYQALLNLVPGSSPARFQNAETDTPARSLQTNVNGQAINSNATRTDGATNVNIWLPSHNMYISPAETVDTVNISTNNFDAEQGMAGGSAVTVITKSGTNQFKGSAFGFYNDERMNARPFYFGSGTKPDKVPVSRKIFGGTLGGPIRHDRLFFFGSYEGYKSSLSLFTFHNVPDARLRNGDFSQALNANGSLQIIYNPFTGNPDGSGRQPFPGNVIPQSLINSLAQKINALYPQANAGGVGAGGLTNNYQRQETRTTDRHNYDTKINFNRTAAHQIWGKFSYMDAVVDDLTNYLGPDPNATGDGGFTKVWQFTTGHTWTLGPSVLFDSTFGFSRQDQQVYGPDFQAGYFGLDTLGIPGTNDPVNRDPRYAGYPRFETGFSALGNRDGWNPIFRDERTYSVSANMTKIMGSHDFRAGYLVNFLYLDHWQPESGNPRGNLIFATNATALRSGAQAGNFYNQYAAFLLGLVSTASKSIQYELMTGREWQHGLFFRDRWNVSDKLTLDLGIRWEYYPIMHRATHGLERIDLNTLEVMIGGLGGNPKNIGLVAGKDNFAPRLGAIYRLNESTVLRGGYGITYNPIPWSRALRGDQIYPTTIPASFFQNEPFSYYNTINQGIPVFTGPDLNAGRFPVPNAVEVTTPEPGNIDRGTIQSWNVAFERRLLYDIAVDVAYVGTRGDGGYALIDINAPQTVGSGNQGRPYFSKGRNTILRSFGQHLKNRYHSLQVAVNKPLTKGLLIKGAYTLSRAMNETDEDGRQTLTFSTPSEMHRNYALAGYDRPHNLQVGFVYQIPWQTNGGSYGNIAKAILSDWTLGGTFGAFSGSPFTVTANGATVNTPSNQQTADLVGPVKKIGQVGSTGTFYDPSAWAQPQGVRFGNTERNQFRGPGGVQLNATIFRSFAVGGTRRLEFRVNATNVTNTPVFANPNTDVTSGSFMRITQRGLENNGYTPYGERAFNLGLRFQF